MERKQIDGITIPFPNKVGEDILLQDFFVVVQLGSCMGNGRSPGEYIPISFKALLCHLVTTIFSRTKDSAKKLSLVWEFSSSIHSIGPLIPLELINIGDVSLLTKGIKVRILDLELEQGTSNQIVDAHPALSTEIPQDHRCIQFAQILLDQGLGEANISFSKVGIKY